MIRFAFLSLLWMTSSCCLCGDAWAQIAIKESRKAVWTFPGAEIVGGQLVAPVDARPKLDRVELTIQVETAVDYKFSQMKARKLPEYERVTLEEVSKNVYRFRSGAPEGQYLLEYTGIDPGIASDEIRVTLERSTPSPIEPEPTDLPVLTKEARRAMQGLVAGMAADMDKAAEAVEKGQARTVLELAGMTAKWDVDTRNIFKKSMAGPLEASLGKDAITPVNAKALREVAAGFRSVK